MIFQGGPDPLSPPLLIRSCVDDDSDVKLKTQWTAAHVPAG